MTPLLEIKCWFTTLNTICRNIRMVKFEPEVYLLNRFIFPASICFHIGAGVGRHTLIMSRLAGKKGRVYCFEPAVYSYKILTRAVRFHRLKNVECYRKAVSDSRGQSAFFTPLKKNRRLGLAFAHLSKNDVPSDQGITEKVEVETLDNFCAQKGITGVDFIRCDVEGAEFLVLKGGKTVIERFHPVVLCEIHPFALHKSGSSAEEVYRFFIERDYRMFCLEDGKLKMPDSIKEEPWRDYFFIKSP